MRPDPELEPAFVEFVEFWGRLLASVDPGRTAVLVEGERDRRSLRGLGWTGPVVIVHRGRSLAATAQALVAEYRHVIVLTDWDTEGGTLARRLREFLEADGIELDLETRRGLARVLRGELVHVEGLYRWARRHAERTGRPLEAWLDAARGDGPPTG